MDHDDPRHTTSRDEPTDGRSEADKAPPTAATTIEHQAKLHLQRADTAETRVRELEEELAYQSREMRMHRVAAQQLAAVLDEHSDRPRPPRAMRDGEAMDEGDALDRISRQP